MSKKKIIIDVKEIITHKVELELDDDAMNRLIEDLDGHCSNDFAGDLCSHLTMQDGEWELEDYEVVA